MSDVENYVVRRFLVNQPTNYLNKMFPSLWSEIDPTNFLPSFRAVLVDKNYPTDERVRRSAVTEVLFDRSAQRREKICLLFECIERHLWAGSGGHAALDSKATIEHIMPQSLDAGWEAELGTNWKETHRDYLNTLGNLTLVTGEWNSALSNSPFQVKKKRFKDNALRLNNQYFDSVRQWNEVAIRDRAIFLVEQILKIWSALGAPSVVRGSTGSKPKTLAILGGRVPVKAWNDVAFKTAQEVADWVDDFEAIALQFPHHFSRQAFPWRSRQLANGWWVNMNLSSASVKSFCRNVVVAAGIPEGDWAVEET